MAAPARNDSTDHLLIAAHLYWLTGSDGDGSECTHYTHRQLMHSTTDKMMYNGKKHDKEAGIA